jgi:putative ABC transport system substrate-binding protein
MRRRTFISQLGGVAVWPLTANAQRNDQVRRIAVLMSIANDREGQRRLNALREGLEKLGWWEGRNIQIAVKWSVSNIEQARIAAKELINRAPDLIVASGSPATVALHETTTTLPVVFAAMAQPVEQRLVQSLAHPGGNITGFSSLQPSLGGKWVELLKTIAPKVTRLAMIFNPDTAPAPFVRPNSADEASGKLGIELVRTPVRDQAEIEVAIRMLQSPTQGFIILPDTFLTDYRKLILDLASLHSLPAMYPFRFAVAEGGLISYGVDLADTFRGAATYVDRILRGDKPADLPVQQPTKFELAINLKTARMLGLEVPLMLLVQADEVIE